MEEARNVILCDLKDLFKWVICSDGTVLVDTKYLEAWNEENGG